MKSSLKVSKATHVSNTYVYTENTLIHIQYKSDTWLGYTSQRLAFLKINFLFLTLLLILKKVLHNI